MEPLNQGITEEEDSDRVEDKAADGLDWEELRIEWRDLFKDNPENRSSWTFVKTSLIIFATSLLPSLFDMGSDALSVYDFINGTTYTKYVSDLSHLGLNSSQCNHVGSHLWRNGNDNYAKVVYEEVECFEQDPIWGYMSLFFILLPGIAGVEVWKGSKTHLCFLTLPIFPFFVLTVKTIGLLNPGENWKLLSRRCAHAEGAFESKFQLLLQLFIVFTRADRAPSTVQLVTMASSVTMLAMSKLDEIRRNQKTVDLGDDVRRAMELFPRILLAIVSDVGYMALLATLLRYWVLLLLVPYLVVVVLYINCRPRYQAMLNDETKGRVSVGLLEMNDYNIAIGLAHKITWVFFTFFLTCLAITANVHPSFRMPGLFWEVNMNFLKSYFSQINRSTVSLTWPSWRRSTCSTPSLASPWSPPSWTLSSTIGRPGNHSGKLEHFKIWNPSWEDKTNRCLGSSVCSSIMFMSPMKPLSFENIF